MSSITSSLKQWGAKGSEYPNGYNYLEGDQPVDEWDNFLTYNIISEIHELQTIVDDRMESDVTGGGTHPSTPEVGHVSHRTDTSNLPTADESTFVYDGTNATWHRLLQADGDKMTGPLDMGGYRLKDSTGPLALNGEVEAQSAKMNTEWFNKQEGGTVSSGSFTVIGTFGLADGESLQITQGMLTEDGFTTPAASNLDLIIADESDAADPPNATPVTVLAGDGTTLYDDETGAPLASYTNTSGAHMTVAVGLDNGYFTTGTGSDVQGYGGYIARKV